MRRKPQGKVVGAAHAVDREYRVLKALHGSGVPVPAVYCLCEDAAVIGSAFYVGAVPGRRPRLLSEASPLTPLLHAADGVAACALAPA